MEKENTKGIEVSLSPHPII